LPRDDGFSLIEVLCAVTVAALALILFMQARTSSTQLNGRIQTEMAARLLASQKFAMRERNDGSVGSLAWRFDERELLRDPQTGIVLMRQIVSVNAADGSSFGYARYVLGAAQ
jgi:prepilin-type N-terminal cleavage/methylation domain-containing protein